MEYERLRSQIVGPVPSGTGRGVGLSLLLREGITAWMHAVRTASVPAPREGATGAPARYDGDSAAVAGAPPRVSLLSAAQHDDVARILAGLVLSARASHRVVSSQGASA